MTPDARGPLRLALLALPLLLAWELSGADLALAQWLVGDAGRFPWRDDALLVRVLHDDGRWAAGFAFAAQLLHAAWPPRPGTPSRRARALWCAMTLVGWLGVAWLKSRSASSCPWDMAGFGGSAVYVPHWRLGVVDGGSGRCFPSGHAVAGYAFFSLAFLWLPLRPRRARRLAVAAAVAGTLFGAAQVLRGAHFASHVAWSAWLCWTASALVSAWRLRAPAAAPRAAPADA